MLPSPDIARLIEIMALLRTPKTGCPWDLAQDFASIVPYTIEEAFEVADAVERGDRGDLRDELGDLLLQVVFHARLAEEEGSFDFGGVVEAITSKLIRRHPHIFGQARDLDPAQVKQLWDAIKADERAERAARRPSSPAPASILDEVSGTYPPLLRATRLQSKAATVGFDWTDVSDVLAKIREEVDEVSEALASGRRADQVDEIGDLLFAVVNLARHARVDPEDALRRTNAKFTRRFGHVERELHRDGVVLTSATLERMEALWREAKHRERTSLDSPP